MNNEKINSEKSFRNGAARKYKAVTYISGIFAALFMSLGMESDAAAAGLPETYPDGQNYEESSQQIYGWQETDGKKYYFLPESGMMASGWTEIDGQSYYFYPDTGQMAAGWTDIDGESYYFLPSAGWMMTGWMDIGGESYYFYPDTGQMAAGWMDIDGESYYFYPDTGWMAAGWTDIGGASYYFQPESGIMASGCWEIDDDTYFFSPETGEMLTGWQETELGRRYFLKAGGEMASGWRKINGRKFYFSIEDGEPAAGLWDIDGKSYLFHPDGHLANEGKTSLVSAGNQIYCADKNGKPASGWQIIGKKLYYAAKTGKVKKDTTYRGISFGSRGAAKNNVNTRLKIKAMKDFASVTNKNMSKSEKLAACWSYLTSSRFRYAAKYPDLDAAGWQRKAAYDMLTSHTGNCYSFACAFAALAEEAGFRPYIVCGRVRGSRDRMADGYTRHAWVKINGKYYDPEAHYAGWRRGIYGNSSYPVSHMIQQIVAF